LCYLSRAPHDISGIVANSNSQQRTKKLAYTNCHVTDDVMWSRVDVIVIVCRAATMTQMTFVEIDLLTLCTSGHVVTARRLMVVPASDSE